MIERLDSCVAAGKDPEPGGAQGNGETEGHTDGKFMSAAKVVVIEEGSLEDQISRVFWKAGMRGEDFSLTCLALGG